MTHLTIFIAANLGKDVVLAVLETEKKVNKAIEHFSVTVTFRIQLGIDGFKQKLLIDKIAPFLLCTFITHQLPDG